MPLVERDRKKAEKSKKFAEKKSKNEAGAGPAVSKTKEKKSKQNSSDGPLPEYVEETPSGEKKCMFKLSVLAGRLF